MNPLLKKEINERLGRWFSLVDDVLGLSNLPLRWLAKRVAELSDVLVGKERFFRYLKEEEYLKAYTAFFFPQGFVRSYFVVRELVQLTDFAEGKQVVKVMDLGAGTGASTFAALQALRDEGVEVEITAVEVVPGAASVIEEVARREGAEIKVEVKDMAKAKLEGFDLILAVTSLSELRGGAGILVRRAVRKGAAFAVVEPAWKKGFDLVRSIARALKLAPVLPCLLAPSCRLEKEGDWCFASVEVTFPKLTYSINQFLRHNLNYVKFTYGVFSAELNLRKKGARVIAPLKREKGKLLLRVCREGEAFWLERLDRDASELNREFEEALCCDIVEFECRRVGTCCRIDKNHHFRKVR